MQICERDLCCGCSACEAACPKSAITMSRDSEGFLRPVVDHEKCVDCGLCQRKCPVNTKAPAGLRATYAAYSKDKAVRSSSSSGGIFAAVAREIIKQGGVVFGAGFDENMRVCHFAVSDNKDLCKLMGSKYVQSDMGDTFKDIADHLRSGRKVLFAGTPCQVAGARNLFGDREDLFLLDFICHGVPTPKIWDKYLTEGFSGVTDASFRDKKRGWEEFSMRVDSENGEYNCSRYTDPYIRMFLENVTLRPSCYSCQWKNPNFAADMTVGDFWGVSKIDPAWNDNKGTSVVVVRTAKGAAMAEKLGETCFMAVTDENKAMSSNGMYYHSTPYKEGRKVFFEKLSADASFKELAAEFGRPQPKSKIIKMRIKLKLKILLGKIRKIGRK